MHIDLPQLSRCAGFWMFGPALRLCAFLMLPSIVLAAPSSRPHRRKPPTRFKVPTTLSIEALKAKIRRFKSQDCELGAGILKKNTRLGGLLWKGGAKISFYTLRKKSRKKKRKCLEKGGIWSDECDRCIEGKLWSTQVQQLQFCAATLASPSTLRGLKLPKGTKVTFSKKKRVKRIDFPKARTYRKKKKVYKLKTIRIPLNLDEVIPNKDDWGTIQIGPLKCYVKKDHPGAICVW